MRVHSAAENVAMSNGFSDVARVAVDGMQKSKHNKTKPIIIQEEMSESNGKACVYLCF